MILSDLELTLPHAASARDGLRPRSLTELLGRRDEPRLGSGSDDAALRVIVTPLALGGVELAAAHRRGHSVGRPSAALPLALAGELRDVLHPPRAARRARGILWTAARAEAAFRDSLPRS